MNDTDQLTRNRDLTGKLRSFDRENGKKLWELALPARPLHDGIAVAEDGRIVVALMNGSIVCIGAE